jgi:hypothetical protein
MFTSLTHIVTSFTHHVTPSIFPESSGFLCPSVSTQNQSPFTMEIGAVYGEYAVERM